MAKTLKSMFEVYEPKPGDEKRFKAKHVIVKTKDKNGNGDDVFQATNIKPFDREPKHGYNPGNDEKVYEEVEPLDENWIHARKAVAHVVTKLSREAATADRGDIVHSDLRSYKTIYKHTKNKDQRNLRRVFNNMDTAARDEIAKTPKQYHSGVSKVFNVDIHRVERVPGRGPRSTHREETELDEARVARILPVDMFREKIHGKYRVHFRGRSYHPKGDDTPYEKVGNKGKLITHDRATAAATTHGSWEVMPSGKIKMTLREEVELNEGAMEAQYDEYATNVKRLLREIEGHVDNHAKGAYKVKTVVGGHKPNGTPIYVKKANLHWGHVGDMKAMHSSLLDLRDRIANQGEYAHSNQGEYARPTAQVARESLAEARLPEPVRDHMDTFVDYTSAGYDHEDRIPLYKEHAAEMKELSPEHKKMVHQRILKQLKMPHHEYTTREIKDIKKIYSIKEDIDVDNSTDLHEISKKLIGRYLDKATDQYASKSMDVERLRQEREAGYNAVNRLPISANARTDLSTTISRDMAKKEEDLIKKAWKRKQGMGKAIKRLTKEDYEEEDQELNDLLNTVYNTLSDENKEVFDHIAETNPEQLIDFLDQLEQEEEGNQ